MDEIDFIAAFEALTGNKPFLWQCALYERFRDGDIPASCNLPTGLGKTAILAIWLIAVGNRLAGVPRRLVYIVNRRTVVDQATREAEKLREHLEGTDAEVVRRLACALTGLAAEPTNQPLAVSTLRGQFADNGEWRTDPARPAVVVGTIDMIGSRLLFSGYRAGFKSRPLHAGFLGQDALVVHDEAHLSPAFQKLLRAIESEQRGGRTRDLRPLRVLELTATSREQGPPPFELTAEEKDNSISETSVVAIVRERLFARKGLKSHQVESGKVAAELARLALSHQESGQAILVYARTIEDVKSVWKVLVKAKQKCLPLTGTVRGLERDRMATEDPIFARFLPDRSGARDQETVYLLCTSAGEVGVDLSADHLLCDLTPFDSMAQRFGRVNRRGGVDVRTGWLREAHIDLVHESGPDPKKDSSYEQARWATLELLKQLPTCDWNPQRRDASPKALGELPPEARKAAFTPEPPMLAVDEILFDAWALTSVRDILPGRPPVEPYLHGLEEGVVPDTHVAWREEVALFSDQFSAEQIENLLDDYPLKPQELLRDRMDRVRKELAALADRAPELPVWVVEPGGGVTPTNLSKLVEKDRDSKPIMNLAERTVLLPPKAGGLTEGGMLDGEAPHAQERLYDVADDFPGATDRPRLRILGSRIDEEWAWQVLGCGPATELRPDGAGRIPGWRVVLDRTWCASLSVDDEAKPDTRIVYLTRGRGDEATATSWSGGGEQGLIEHLERVERIAECMVNAVGLTGHLRDAVVKAAAWHDKGKHRGIWQRGVGNRAYPGKVLAKTGRGGFIAGLEGYRHEFGSLLETEQAFAAHPELDVILHLIAAHHGRGRPHFLVGEAFDPDHPEEVAARVAQEVPRRYARLQRRFGRWGLAWLESLLRAADALGSEV